MPCSISLDWSYKGMRTLVMENSSLRVVLLLDKGSDIMEMRFKPLDINLMWQSPLGWRNPLKDTAPNPNLDGSFLDYYGGGWQDIAPSAGGHPVTHRGVRLGVHGESAMLPWSCMVEEESGWRVTAYMRVDGVRYPFKLEKRITLTEKEEMITFNERLTNTGRQTLEFSWVQHPSFGEPFLEPGSKIELPEGGTVIVQEESYNPLGRLRQGEYEWPNVKDRNGRDVDLSIIPNKDLIAEETSFITGLEAGRYVIWNKRLGLGFEMRWDTSLFRYLWFWQNYNTPDYPWYGMAWNIALEPCTSYPGGLSEQIKAKTHLELQAGAYVETEYKVKIIWKTK
ncbi:MAG: DUF4432 family protein, partial [Nitrososphaerota archaeon]